METQCSAEGPPARTNKRMDEDLGWHWLSMMVVLWKSNVEISFYVVYN